MTFTICLIEGDGIGKEVVPAAARVLSALDLPISFTQAEAGWECFCKCGDALPEATLDAMRAADATLFGATQSPLSKVDGYRSPVLSMRKLFDLYANLRPTRTLPIPGTYQGVDLLIVRENTEGLYSGRERRADDGQTAITERVITAAATERIARLAFQQALRRPRRKVTIVHKANVLKEGDGLFREVCLRVAAEFPQVSLEEMLVDACAMWLVRDPTRFDVIVTENLFGDILSDEAAGLIGGLGVAPSANLGAGKVAYFEPVHGSAPDIVGRGIANPIGAILSAAMLLEHLGATEAARRVEAAVQAALRRGTLTRDLGGNASTAEMTDAILKAL
ncbi:MAG: isocitrate dehydrogenase [Candidatus Thermofonsia Clade 1 bacterium]|jgi:homoisocitrate dehydrogenase|uniref:Isocitrate/homoisocitrate dehydrogenase n=1 Tax=Candidatus Thermofonsia Clade 1 bacterium TaxID=2364210 RepID=A0A2M8Q012_9CHLR|nr:MAG: isocitrate dehydrogenase [Candidatus Thermofonsia Clade 1 bacterium]PJF43115.1 MAG: isocitrate dehydrogenase [Candidatus Thermofonsia Clade 1 bacterium]RMF51939.1 MAG: isocitrate/isopropylmalate dehydrogenase family protein [Chloroflexota bacterium]